MEFRFAVFLELSHGLWRRGFPLHNVSPKRDRFLLAEPAFAGRMFLRQLRAHGGDDGTGKFNPA